MINDTAQIVGKITSWKLFAEDGSLKAEGSGPNLVTTVGKNRVAALLGGTSTALMSHMALGSSGTSPAVGNTTLGTELGRVALSSTTVLNNTITYVGNFGAGIGTGTIAEAGIFDASSGGTMLCRSISISLTKGATDTLQLTWVVTVN